MLKPILIRIAPLAVVVLLAGCGSGVDFVRLDPTVFPPKPSDAPIEVIQGAAVTPHVVIGVVTAGRSMEATTGSVSTYDEVVRILKERAREVGGDALAELKPTHTTEGSIDTRVELTAKVVRFLEKQATIATK